MSSPFPKIFWAAVFLCAPLLRSRVTRCKWRDFGCGLSEHFAKKGANEVVTCLLWYITNVVPATCTDLHIYCDNTYGQNKNRYLFAVLQHLTNNRFAHIYVRYPVPGHSRMPIDDDLCDDGRVVLDVKDFKSALESVLLTPQKANLNLQNTRELMFTPRQLITVNFSERFEYPKRELSLFKPNVTAES
ncbi:unnamed protein product [Allacma fusca]|uniref:DUF7869 domain-containing protein n=1 Tax=Allacma fusca TaxID=39272 RepID=A0A8J2PVJ6_9HEXA|nr:unnamed protein product [Allacma fusca]